MYCFFSHGMHARSYGHFARLLRTQRRRKERVTPRCRPPSLVLALGCPGRSFLYCSSSNYGCLIYGLDHLIHITLHSIRPTPPPPTPSSAHQPCTPGCGHVRSGARGDMAATSSAISRSIKSKYNTNKSTICSLFSSLPSPPSLCLDRTACVHTLFDSS